MSQDVSIRIPLLMYNTFVLYHLGYKGNYIHIGVGFDVAYLSELGKFDGLESEISGKYGSHASFY